MADFYTYLQDVRGDRGGSRVSYKPAAAILGSLEQGEMVGWDASNKVLVRFVRDASAGKFVGIAADSAKRVRSLGNQPPLDPDLISVFTTGIHNLVGTAAETYAHGDVVYMNGTDTTKVTKTAGGGTAIGVAWLPDGSTRVGAVRVPILIDNHTTSQA